MNVDREFVFVVVRQVLHELEMLGRKRLLKHELASLPDPFRYPLLPTAPCTAQTFVHRR